MVRPALSTGALRWVLLPTFVGVLVLIGLAVGTETRDEFQQSRADAAEADTDDPPENGDRPSDQGRNSEGSGSGSGSAGGSGSGFESNREPGSGSERGSTGADDGPRISFEVRGREGRVGVRLDDSGSDLAFPVSNDGDPGVASELVPGRIPEGSGLRLERDGELRATPLDETGRGDVVLVPVEGGVDVQLPDGDRVEVRPNPSGSTGDQESGRLDLNRMGSDGAREQLEPADDGSVNLGDGVEIQLPADNGQIPAVDDPVRIRWLWFVVWLVAMTAASLALAFHLHRNGPPLFDSAAFTPPEDVAVTSFVAFLALLRDDPDPARAIRLAFEGAEHGLGSLPARAETETPFEWHARVAHSKPHLDETLLSAVLALHNCPVRPGTANERRTRCGGGRSASSRRAGWLSRSHRPHR